MKGPLLNSSSDGPPGVPGCGTLVRVLVRVRVRVRARARVGVRVRVRRLD